MFFKYAIIAKVVFTIAGLVWCKGIFGRLRKDVQEFKSSEDTTARIGFSILWVMTAVIAVVVGSWLLEGAGAIVHALK